MSVEDPGSITRWLDGLRAGRPDAADAIWRRYHERVLELARHRLQSVPHQSVEDDEDVALSAMNDLYAGAVQGRFTHLRDRGDLWYLLVDITVKKALLRQQWYGRVKRGGGQVIHTETSAGEAEDASQQTLDALAFLASREPPPESTAIIGELLDSLPDPALRQIAEWRMAGLNTIEIARKMGCVVRTVARRLERIRMIWEEIGFAPGEGPQASRLPE